jgi:hypothetical protein
MYRLGELSESRRKAIGATLLILGGLGLALGVFWIHWASFPVTERVNGVDVPVVVDFANWFPRGALWKGVGYVIVFGATTMALAGAAIFWVLNQTMTWSRAIVAAMIAWIALVFYFGMVPSEWLNFAQTDLVWSGQRVALTIPPILILGNHVDISYGAIKDIINLGYYHAVLIGAGVLALQLQKIKAGRPAKAQAEAAVSPYGRPLIRGDR